MKFLEAIFSSKPKSDGGAALIESMPPEQLEQVRQFQLRFRREMEHQKQGRFSPALSLAPEETWDLDLRLRAALSRK